MQIFDFLCKPGENSDPAEKNHLSAGSAFLLPYLKKSKYCKRPPIPFKFCPWVVSLARGQPAGRPTQGERRFFALGRSCTKSLFVVPAKDHVVTHAYINPGTREKAGISEQIVGYCVRYQEKKKHGRKVVC